MGLITTITRLFRRSGIEAGAGGRRWAGWQGIASGESSTLAARRPAKDRATAASMNTPAGSRIVEVWTGNLIGKGWQARSQHPDRDTARRLNSEFEAAGKPGPALPCARLGAGR